MTRHLDIVAELNRIAREHGGVARPEDVVEAARPPDSVLHSRFQWDDTKAAAQYRLFQARQLLRVTIIMRDKDERSIVVPTFTSLTTERGQGYRATTTIFADPDLALQQAVDVLRQVERLIARANNSYLTAIHNCVAIRLNELEEELDSKVSSVRPVGEADGMPAA
jgi:hypothetical protein